MRTGEQQLAGLSARLRSLEELDAHRAGFGDAARLVLSSGAAGIRARGALADFLEVESRYERAVEACLGDLLQYVVVDSLEQVTAGLRLVRDEDAGRCGFIVVDGDEASAEEPLPAVLPAGVRRLGDVVQVQGAFPDTVRRVLGGLCVADTFEAAAAAARLLGTTVVTLDGDVFRGRHQVSGGAKAESRGILATKREIKELRERIAEERLVLARLADESVHFEQVMAEATAGVQRLGAEIHRQEKAIVAAEAQEARAAQDEARVSQRRALVDGDIARVRDEIAALDLRQAEARESIARLDADKRVADELFSEQVLRLTGAREQAEQCSQRVAEVRAELAAFTERLSALEQEVVRMEQSATELERRLAACQRDIALMGEQRERLVDGVGDHERQLDEDVRLLESLREQVREADDRAGELRTAVETQDQMIRDARRALDAIRALASELEVSRATAEAELTHLAQQAYDAVGVTLQEVRQDVEAMEAAGIVEPDVRAIRAAEAADPDEDEVSIDADAGDAPVPDRMTAEEAITELRGKIDRIGPVNMMAIEQHAELEQRHVFLTTQRQDLLDSIAQTNEAIRRIDETTHARFRDAFTAINLNFQDTFSTLFGGGKAGISLIDDTDPLESGIDIVASPPGKRLQSVMLLSGGEKALTAIALMFAIFRYKPSPFCLLDEIDAPLDDANIGRFVELLRGMMDRTQFIIITHSRKTMEIANRLYGVTMEEPGVSKLISIQLH